MANEGSYQYAAPGGVMSASHSVYMRRYREPAQVESGVGDFVTFGDIIDTVKANPLLFGALGVGAAWWFFGRGG